VDDHIRTTTNVEDSSKTLERIRHHLDTLVGWRTSESFSPRDEAMYQSLCDAERKFLSRIQPAAPAPGRFDLRHSTAFRSIVSSSSSASRVLAN
jgi:hypothetical protein